MFDSSHLLYSVIGAVSFAILGVIATYYRDDNPSKKSVARDFVAGSLMVSFVMLLMPDLFPKMSFNIPLPTIDDVLSRSASMAGGGGKDSGYDIQLGI
jgi:hypothetical protein